MCDYIKLLKDAIENNPEELIEEWIKEINVEEKDEEYRYYDDFLGFFEECLNSNLDIHSDEAAALKLFLEKLIEIKGIENFFNFKDSVYTCYLKFPILKYLEKHNCFNFKIASHITNFFESLTSKIIVELIKQQQKTQEEAMNELEEREAPISEIWDGVLMVSIVGTLDSNRVLKIMDKILDKLDKNNIDYVIIDISAIYDMNSEVARQIIKLNNSIHFMGATAMLSGITPVIAKNLTHLDLNLGEIKTFSTTKKAMKLVINEKLSNNSK